MRQCTTKPNAGTFPMNMYEKELPIGERELPWKIACVAGVQRGGRGEVECEREAPAYKGEGEGKLNANDRASLAFNFPSPSPLYAGHAGYLENGYQDSECDSGSDEESRKGASLVTLISTEMR